jgi:hypothetical protein
MQSDSTRPRWSSRPRTVDQFWERGNRSDHLCVAVGTYCLDWVGATINTGYGMVTIRGRKLLAHRAAWEYTYGTIPVGIQVLHRCDRPICFEPTHLFLGTQKDNAQDMAKKGRQWLQCPERVKRGADFIPPPGWVKRGEANRKAIFTEDDVREMRRLRSDGMILKDIAAKFGIHLSTVHLVVTRKSWSHVE